MVLKSVVTRRDSKAAFETEKLRIFCLPRFFCLAESASLLFRKIKLPRKKLTLTYILILSILYILIKSMKIFRLAV